MPIKQPPTMPTEVPDDKKKPPVEEPPKDDPSGGPRPNDDIKEPEPDTKK